MGDTVGEFERAGAMPRKLLDGLGIAAALLDARSGRILHANAIFCRTLNRKLSEVLKSGNMLRFVHPEDRRSYLVCTNEYVKGLVDRSRFEARYLRADGGSIHMRTTQSGIRDHTGTLVWITLVLDDLDEAASNGKDRLRDIAGNKITIWSWTPENNALGAPAAYDVLLGLPNNSSPSIEQLTDRVHPDDARAVKLLLRRSMRGLSGSQDYRRLENGTKVRWVRDMVAPMKDAAGRLTNVIGMSIDITDSKSQKSSRKSDEMLSVIQHLQTHWHKRLVLSEVARQYNVGARSLQKYFASLGTTPVDFLKRIRLVHAYDMLSGPSATTTVSKICTRCGFGNLGHFARDYRTEFGELPSETLLRARARNRASASPASDR